MNNIEETIRLSHVTIENAPDCYFWVKSNGDIIRVNKATCESLGYTSIEFETLKVYDINLKIEKYSWKNFWNRVKRDQSISGETHLKTKNGDIIPVLGTSVYVKIGNNEYICGYTRDISDRVKLETTLRESESKYLNLIRGSVQGILIHRNFKVLFSNQVAADILGYKDPEDLLDVDLMGHSASEKLKAETISLTNALVRGEQVPYGKEIEFIRKNGSHSWIDRIITPINWEGSDAVLVTLNDISRYKNTEESLRSALGELSHLKNKLQLQNAYLQSEIKDISKFGDMTGSSDALSMVITNVEQVAPTDATVLIQGESGTGKELVARSIHRLSKRSDHPIIKIDCSSIPDNLIESELFGHEKGAFTGAIDKKIGRFELADKATVFLDEIGNIPYSLQAKFLRFLQDGEFERIGNPRPIKVDARVISATNCNLWESVISGNFREDLYYRLNVFPIYCPPLRDRKDDIPLLTHEFVDIFSAKIGKSNLSISDATMKKLVRHDWPGNIRELENVIERAVILSTKSQLEVGDQIGDLHNSDRVAGEVKTLRAVEYEMIKRALITTNGIVAGKYGAAAILDVPASTLRRRIAEYNIHVSGSG